MPVRAVPSEKAQAMTTAPRLTIGLPVYNGEKYIAESLDALLGQTYTDFELIISDNASTDGTADICHRYVQQDSRVRYIRQPKNIGLAPNHNVVVEQARGELFKWASNDDLYARELVERCVDALDKYPDVVLAHSWTARVNGSGTVTKAYQVPAQHGLPADAGALPEPAVRQRGRRRLRRYQDRGAPPDGDEGELPSRGPHHHRRAGPVRPVLPGPGLAVLPAGPCRPGRARVPDDAEPVREHGPAPGGPAAPSGGPAVRRIHLGVTSARSGARRCRSADRRECYRYLAQWLASRVRQDAGGQDEPVPVGHQDIPVDSVVAGQGRFS